MQPGNIHEECSWKSCKPCTRISADVLALTFPAILCIVPSHLLGTLTAYDPFFLYMTKLNTHISTMDLKK